MQLEVALNHPIKAVVNALGAPPKFMVDAARAKGIAVGALTGSREHAMKNVEAGVDFLVVSGTEAGGHCGEISTMVVVPEVLETLRQLVHHKDNLVVEEIEMSLQVDKMLEAVEVLPVLLVVMEVLMEVVEVQE